MPDDFMRPVDFSKAVLRYADGFHASTDVVFEDGGSGQEGIILRIRPVETPPGHWVGGLKELAQSYGYELQVQEPCLLAVDC